MIINNEIRYNSAALEYVRARGGTGDLKKAHSVVCRHTEAKRLAYRAEESCDRKQAVLWRGEAADRSYVVHSSVSTQ